MEQFLINFVTLDAPIFVPSFLLLYILLRSKSIEKRMFLCFLFSIIAILLMGITGTLEREFYNGSGAPTWLRMLNLIVGHIAKTGVPVTLCFIALRNVKTRWPYYLLVPYAFTVILLIVTIFAPIVFGYDEAGQLYYGPLGFWPFAFAAGYCFLLFLLSFCYTRRRYSSEAYIILLFMVLVAISVACDIMFDLPTLVPLTVIIVVTFYFLHLSRHRLECDALTDVLNRSSLQSDYEKRKARISCIAIFDLNGLKQINDEQGHAEGDKALVTFATYLQEHLSKKARVYRTGGDEFTVLYFKMDLNSARDDLKKVQKGLLDIGISAAYGVLEFDQSKNLKENFDAADKIMYRHKKEMKGALGQKDR